MTDYQPQQSATPELPPEYAGPAAPLSPPPARSRRKAIIATAVGVAAIAGAVVGIVAATGGSSPAAKMIPVRGALSLGDAGSVVNWMKETSCSGEGGYDDIAAGAQVIISDDAGKTLALAELGPGVFNQTSARCDFAFSASVPAGKSFYGVEVTHRGIIKETADSLGAVNMTLGD